MLFVHNEGGGYEPPSRTRILLVEDEDLVRSMLKRALERDGYHVTDVPTAEAALKAFDQAAYPVDLVITDVILPGRSGKDLWIELSQREPGLPVVFMSGYSEEILLQKGQAIPDSIFLGKPFTPSALRIAVTMALDVQSRKTVGNDRD